MELLLRTGAGVPLDAFALADTAAEDGVLGDLVTRVDAVDASWGVGDGPRWVLTEKGRLLETEVALRLQ